MTLVFVSNYINHHQLPFCDACHRLLGDGFTFIQTEAMERERLEIGWDEEGQKRTYVRFVYKEKEPLLRLIADSDILIAGWSEDAEVLAAVQKRVLSGRLTFCASERIYKTGRWRVFSPRGLVRNYRERTRHRRRPYYLLCVGAHVAADYRLIAAFPGKKYRWGYFPAVISYGEELWQAKKAAATVRICWAGCFIPLKRPEWMLRLARDLRAGSRPFELHMVGGGEMEEELRRMAREYGLDEAAVFHGVCTPARTREIMATSHIFVLCSNRIEGWGAVLNEAMNAACAVVATSEAGATGYLVADGENGFAYRGRYATMRDMVLRLCDDAPLRERLGRAAYRSITEVWNAERAAGEFLRFCRDEGLPPPGGPMSVEG